MAIVQAFDGKDKLSFGSMERLIPLWVSIFFLIVFSIFTVVGMISNIFKWLKITFSTQNKATAASKILYTYLSATDLVLIIVLAGGWLPSLIHGSIGFFIEPKLCAYNLLLKNWLLLASSAFYTLISINRYATIAYSQHVAKYFSKAKCAAYGVLIYLAAFLAQTPYLFFVKGTYIPKDKGVVSCTSEGSWQLTLFEMVHLSLFCVLLVVSVSMYFKLHSRLTKPAIPLSMANENSERKRINRTRRNAVLPGQTDRFHLLLFVSRQSAKLICLSTLIIVDMIKFAHPIVNNHTPSTHYIYLKSA
uniref:G-protein coupled receptors family 1 profile domain-containing protein n=1 Tax=Ditylenchus dipsaci TaxID=166011 RepID=A0A915DS73_9BILA